MEHFDVVIVGGAMVGASLACALRGLPLRVAIIEKVATPTRLQKDFDSRSLAISYGSQRILQTLGVWSDLASHAQILEQIHVSDRGHFGFTRFTREHNNQQALGYVIEANVINQTLSRHHQASLFCPATLIAISRSDEKNRLRILQNEQEVEVSCDLLVGADGVDSAVRRLQQIAVTKTDYPHQALVTTIGLARDHHGIAFERFTEEGPIALLPLCDQRAALVWSQSPEKISALLQCTDAQFLRSLQQAFGYRAGKFVRVGKRASYPLQLIRATAQITEGSVLLGNAAHTIHPIAGQGFNLGLRDVSVLAQVIAQACREKQSLGSVQALERYAQKREADHRAILSLTDLLARGFANSYFPVAMLRNTLLNAFNFISPLRSLLLAHMLGMAGEVSDLACGIVLHEEA